MGSFDQGITGALIVGEGNSEPERESEGKGEELDEDIQFMFIIQHNIILLYTFKLL